MIRKIYENLPSLETVLEWLIEVWALIRGLVILALVVTSIIINLAENFKTNTEFLPSIQLHK